LLVVGSFRGGGYAAQIGDIAVEEPSRCLMLRTKIVVSLPKQKPLIECNVQMIQTFGKRAPGQTAKLQIFLVMMAAETLGDVRRHRPRGSQKLTFQTKLFLGRQGFTKPSHLISEIPTGLVAVQLFKTPDCRHFALTNNKQPATNNYQTFHGARREFQSSSR